MQSIFNVSEIQVWLFCVATLLNVLVGKFGVVAKSIEYFIKIFASKRSWERQKNVDMEDPLIPIAIKNDLEDRNDLSKAIGVVERELYLYCFFTLNTWIVSPIVLFKAFSVWLASPKNDNVSERKSYKSQASYYSYAIGTFISLAWALLIFEGLTKFEKECGLIKYVLALCSGISAS